jgi:hypothetical protein
MVPAVRVVTRKADKECVLRIHRQERSCRIIVSWTRRLGTPCNRKLEPRRTTINAFVTAFPENTGSEVRAT